MTVSVADLNAIQLMPHSTYRRTLARWEASVRGSYADFLKEFYPDLDECINALRTIVHQVQDDGEDRITSDLVLQLQRLGYEVTHDAQVGGHVDVAVKSGPHTWIGEAKLNWKIDEGMLQLTTRYLQLNGNHTNDHGGLLLYLTHTDDAKSKLDNWKLELEAMPVTCRPCPENPLAFFSEHKMPGTGLQFNVRTMAVALYWKPQDASGKATAARRSAAVAAAPAANPATGATGP
jgi:hypothetical protein